MRMRESADGKLVSLVASVALIVTQTSPAWADCANDSQCKGDRICENGQCVSPPPKPAAPASPAPAPQVTPVPSSPPAAAAPPTSPRATTALGAFHVRFSGRDEARVAMQQRGVSQGECLMPCSLELQPGEYTLKGAGYERDVEVPLHDLDIAFKRGCTACYITGGILLAASIPFFIAGNAIVNANPKGDGESPGYAAIGTGAVFAVSGAVLLIVGVAVGGSGVVVKERDDNASTFSPARGVATRTSPFGLAEGGGLSF